MLGSSLGAGVLLAGDDPHNSICRRGSVELNLYLSIVQILPGNVIILVAEQECLLCIRAKLFYYLADFLFFNFYIGQIFSFFFFFPIWVRKVSL